jgi:predicted TIM-barrel fold metal-dependent hydrolase
MAGWPDYPPSHPPTLADVDAGAYDPHARVRRLDEFGIQSQFVYPNILGFYSGLFASMADAALALECVRAYNDFLSDFCSAAPGRLHPLMMLPYWDVEASVREIERAAGRGHRGVVMGVDYSAVGLGPLSDERWAPVLEAAQGLELPVSFHIGFAAQEEQETKAHQKMVDRARYVKETALFMLGNATQVAEVITSGLCERYPRLAFVSVESGASWLPFLIESLDWQWRNSGARRDHPDRLMPSEYFRRQVYGSFWFERDLVREAIRLYPDNIMFESDYPHPTSLSPGPCSTSLIARDMADVALEGLAPTEIAKVLHGTAARIYGLGELR